MIIDSLQGLERHLYMNKGFEKAFRFLRSTNLNTISTGRHEIDGNEVYALVSEQQGKPANEAKLEVHDTYIDIQVLIAGNETMGWKDRATCNEGEGKYDDEKDIAFYDDMPDVFFSLEPLQAVIFFPYDAHAPMIADETIKKVVVKVHI